ncbi:hypothetical protein DERF_014938 [Dermatophagoides farinae]|uniref:Uncharacterized protein n=1 Tax=Dermatophagoides farinae TaxID=6954 RepID=A0A922HQ10_DERFA|nr:hypothetical protein DERF_014938 [Dermatophagoides farinae]
MIVLRIKYDMNLRNKLMKLIYYRFVKEKICLPIFFDKIRSSSTIIILSHFKCFNRQNNEDN